MLCGGKEVIDAEATLNEEFKLFQLSEPPGLQQY
jgi:hypothetical protein